MTHYELLDQLVMASVVFSALCIILAFLVFVFFDWLDSLSLKNGFADYQGEYQIKEQFNTTIMKSGIELIAQERKEQIEKHGFDIKNDATYGNEELLKGALFCIDQKRFEFPWNWIVWYRSRIIHKSRVDQLKVAGALIAAEIDRLQYIEQRKKTE